MKKIKVLMLAIFLLIISSVVIIANGKTYTLKIGNWNYTNSINELVMKIDDEKIVKCIDKSLEDGVLNITLKSISKGKTYLTITNPNTDVSYLQSIYVHEFGIITVNEYIGDSNYNIIIPISIIIWLVYALYLLIISYKKSIKENMYQYKNIAYLGIIIFTSFSIISQLFGLFNYAGIISIINRVLNMFSFAMVLLPLTFIVSILVIISNIILMRKEGFNLTNMLGFFLGVLLCLTTITPEIMYNKLFSSTWIDIHNQNGIGLYVYNLVETVIYITITYIECVLIGTIIIGFKSARHIPKFDKDYIIILGCQMKKDGTLTKLLKGRVDRAIEFSKMQKDNTNKDIIFIPSGGKGNDEIISESLAMKNYLLKQGIKEENILMEDKSKNTFENIKFSNELIKANNENAKVAFSTTNYHVFRAGNFAALQGIDAEGIGAKTKSYFWINAFIREFIATIFSEKKKHIAVMCSIIFLAVLVIAITYFNNNI